MKYRPEFDPETVGANLRRLRKANKLLKVMINIIQNFSIDKFYAVEKPVVVEPEPVDSSINTQ